MQDHPKIIPRKTILNFSNQITQPKLSIKKIKISQKSSQPTKTFQTPSFQQSNLQPILPNQQPCFLPCYNLCNPCISYMPNFYDSQVSGNVVEKKNIDTDTNDLIQGQNENQSEKQRSKQKQTEIKFIQKKVYVPVPQIIPIQIPPPPHLIRRSLQFSRFKDHCLQQSLRSKLERKKDLHMLQLLQMQRNLYTQHNHKHLYKKQQLPSAFASRSLISNMKRNKCYSFRQKYQNQILKTQRQYKHLEKKLKNKFDQDIFKQKHININYRCKTPQHQHIYINRQNPQLQHFSIERSRRMQAQQNSNKISKQLRSLTKYLY